MQPHPAQDVPSAAHEHLLAALEGGCAILMTLEALRAQALDPSLDLARLRAELAGAAAAVKPVIAQIRLAMTDSTSAMASGFVLSERSVAAGGAAAES